MGELDVERGLILIVAMAGIVGGILIARNKRYLLVPILLVYESVALFLLLKSDQNIAFAIIEQALAIAFIYVVASSLESFGSVAKATVLAIIFPIVMVLIAPFRIYLVCGVLFLCDL